MTEVPEGVVKYCQMCNVRMIIPDWFAACPTKYCPHCAQESLRLSKAAYMKRKRAEARERRKLERQYAMGTDRENNLLREAVRAQAERIRTLERLLGGDDDDER